MTFVTFGVLTCRKINKIQSAAAAAAAALPEEWHHSDRRRRRCRRRCCCCLHWNGLRLQQHFTHTRYFSLACSFRMQMCCKNQECVNSLAAAFGAVCFWHTFSAAAHDVKYNIIALICGLLICHWTCSHFKHHILKKNLMILWLKAVFFFFCKMGLWSK